MQQTPFAYKLLHPFSLRHSMADPVLEPFHSRAAQQEMLMLRSHHFPLHVCPHTPVCVVLPYWCFPCWLRAAGGQALAQVLTKLCVGIKETKAALGPGKHAKHSRL